MKKLLCISILFLFCSAFVQNSELKAQILKKILKKTTEKVEEKVEQKTEEAIENAMDENESTPTDTAAADNTVNSGKIKGTDLQSYSKYDFVPGDRILLFEDFSTDAVGDFPARWTTNGSGEVKTLNIAPGHWFHLNTENNMYQLAENLVLPENYIIEFDVIVPKKEGYSGGISVNIFKSENPDPTFIENFIDAKGIGIHADYETDWEAGFLDGEWKLGNSELAKIEADKVEHIIIWVQQRRVRIYHAGQKVLDLPTFTSIGFKPDRFAFNLSNCAGAVPYVSNLRITTAAPDTRNKLLTDGKIITYGIQFDVGSAVVKPESFGTINEIAKAIISAGIKVKITGHTDNTGNAEANLDLSRRRAESVKSELIKMGVNASLLSTDGAGSSQPIATNETATGRAQNRRVEFTAVK